MALSQVEKEKLKELSVKNLGILKKSDTTITLSSHHLIIGLGGMGLKTIVKIKRQIIQKMGNVDRNKLRFLALDTDERDVKQYSDIINGSDEFIHMYYSGLNALITNPNITPEPIKSVLPEGYNPAFNGMGAGQRRLSGRLAIMGPKVLQEIESRIGSILANFRSVDTAPIEVYIIAGLGGGTGSGTIIDLPYFIDALCGDRINNVRYFGYIYLPDVYDSIPNVNHSLARANSYAALKEIDYYMNIAETGGRFAATYTSPNHPNVISHNNIFDLCTVIGGLSNNEITVNNDDALSNAAENIINLITEVKSNEAEPVMMAQSFIDNAGTALTTVLGLDPNERVYPRDCHYKYQCVGAGNIKLPVVSIYEYVVNKVFVNMLEKLQDNVNQQAIIDSCLNIKEQLLLSPDDIIDPIINMNTGEIYRYIGGLNFDRVYFIGGNALINLDTKIEGWHIGIATELNTAAEGVLNAYIKNNIVDSTMGLFAIKQIIISNTGNGGTFEGLKQTLVNYITLASEIRSQIQKEINDNSATKLKYENIAQDNINRMFGPLSRVEKNGYADALKRLYISKLKLKLIDELIAYYGTIQSGNIHNLVSMLDWYVKLADIVEETAVIARENIVLSSRELGIVNNIEVVDTCNILNDSFIAGDPNLKQFKNLIVNDFQQKISNITDRIDANLINSFGSDLMNPEYNWHLPNDNGNDRDNNYISNFRRFMYANFSDVADKDIKYYISHFTGNVNSLITTLINRLDNNASVMFKPCAGAEFHNYTPYKFMVCPQNINNPQWINAFEEAAGGNILYGPDGDTIYLFEQYCCFTLWMYISMRDFEKDYENSIESPGLHINENTQNPTYRNYPSPLLKSSWVRINDGTNNPYYNQREDEYVNNLDNTFTRSLDLGIIKVANDEYFIYSIDNFDNRIADELYAIYIQDDMSIGFFDYYIQNVPDVKYRSYVIKSTPIMVANTSSKAMRLLRTEMHLVAILNKTYDQFNKYRRVIPESTIVKKYIDALLWGVVNENQNSFQLNIGAQPTVLINLVILTRMADQNVATFFKQNLLFAAYIKFKDKILTDGSINSTGNDIDNAVNKKYASVYDQDGIFVPNYNTVLNDTFISKINIYYQNIETKRNENTMNIPVDYRAKYTNFINVAFEYLSNIKAAYTID